MFNATRTATLLTLLCNCVALIACGSGDAPTEQTTSVPAANQALIDTADQSSTTAASLPAPISAEPPTLTSTPPPAPADGPPPRAPLLPTAKFPLSPGPEALLAPSVLRRTIVSGLIAPTDLVFANDGTLFYTERGQGLFMLRPGTAAVQIFAPKELTRTGSAMLAVTLDPEFPRNRFVYVLMRSLVAGTEGSRVIRVTLDSAYISTMNRQDILIAPAAGMSNQVRNDKPDFSGSLRFGPDGYLHVGLGEGQLAMAPQSTQTLVGTLLRIDRDGQPAPNNKAPPGFDKRVFVYGLRDLVALSFQPHTEAAIVGRRRMNAPDDMVMVQSGGTSGWDPRCASPKASDCERAVKRANEVDPRGFVTAWKGNETGEGLSAIERLRDPMWGEWRNAFVVAFDQGKRLDFIKLNAAGRTVQSTTVLRETRVGFKAAAQGPDGLYVITRGRPGGDEIWRLSPL